MSFQNVTWNENDALTSAKVQKMIDNDELNFHLCSLAPLGYLGGINIEDLDSSARTLNQTAVDAAKLLLKFNIHNKTARLNLNSFYTQRFVKICVSEIRISDPTSTDRWTTTPFTNLPNQRIFQMVFKFNRPEEVSRLNPVETVYSVAKPSRYTTSGVNSPTNWRTQAFEFLYPLDFNFASEDFELQIDIYKAPDSVTPVASSNNTYTLISGNIWVEDAGANITDTAKIASTDGFAFQQPVPSP